jgi:hypothetical protein
MSERVAVQITPVSFSKRFSQFFRRDSFLIGAR